MRVASLAALIGLFVALYLLLYHLGFYGALLCGAGSCDVVQASEYARFLGQPVPGWGVAWYAAVFVLCLLALWSRAGEAGWAFRTLAVAVGAGLAFTAYLTWIELFVIRAICLWCVMSALLTLAVFLFVAPWRAVGSRAAGSPG